MTESSTENTNPHPSEFLMALIVTLLAPMFLGVTAGDIALARVAAKKTIDAYQARGHADLIAVAQVIAYGLAALGSLSLSMDDGISLSMALRLRGNANALDRAAERNRRAIRENHPGDHASSTPEALPRLVDAQYPVDPQYKADVLARLEDAKRCAAAAQARLQSAEPPAAVPIPPDLTFDDTRRQAAWASAMIDKANEVTASLVHLPPAARKEASRRAALLSGYANDLLSGDVPARRRPGALDGIPRNLTR
jgi:hypothetical protein